MSSRKKRTVFGYEERKLAHKFKYSDPKKYKASLSVAQVVGAGRSGTAWRVGPGNFMITNRHVMHTDNPEDYTISFSDGFGHDLSVKANKIITHNHSLDYVLFSVNPYAFNSGALDKYGFLEIDPRGAIIGDHIYIPQHGCKKGYGCPKTITISNVDTIDFLQGHLIGYKSDTTPGSSGAPVISSLTQKVIGLNRSENENDNYATNSSFIWKEINEIIYDRTKIGNEDDLYTRDIINYVRSFCEWFLENTKGRY